MKITFLGGADEVGASSILIETGGRRVLVDAGIRPSPKARWGLAGDQLPDLSSIDAAGGIDAILVTHAHTDHTGALELVTARYPDIPVYATAATIALTRVLHQDSHRIMQSRLEEEGELPLFDGVAVEKLISSFSPIPFGTRLPISDSLTATYFPAGHIAGAAMIGLESDEGRLLITGDLSISEQRTVNGARPPAFRPDVLVIESTYGGRLHANRSVQERKLVDTIGEVVESGGKVLIPAFALGRAQELLLILSEFRRRGELPDVPVWADGMVRAICQTYDSFAEDLPLPLQERGARFYDEKIRPVERSEQRNALVWQPEPAVIIASSGMLAGGPSLSYARALAGQPQHAILLTGYQDEESPGRRLQEVAERFNQTGQDSGVLLGSSSIRLGKDKVDVQCRLGTYSLSAHADESQLISLIETLDPVEVMLVHGDQPARESLRLALKDRGRSVHLPRSGQSFQFRFAPAAVRKIIPRSGMGREQPPQAAILWDELADSAGYFTLSELARMWWGEAGEDRKSELEEVLSTNDLYFIQDDRRPELYRFRPRKQVEVALQRREQIAGLTGAVGHWLVIKDQDALLAVRCLSTAADHLVVELGDGEIQPVWPEAVIDVLGEQLPAASALDHYRQENPIALKASMEPNQALAYASGLFPPEARLRKAGYHIEQRSIVLTFDFPEAAILRYGEFFTAIKTGSGWDVEVNPEANQAALNALVREVLPTGWTVIKGPAIFREARRVSASLRVDPAYPTGSGSSDEISQGLEAARQRFQDTSGYTLDLVVAQPEGTSTVARIAPAGEGGTRWEINATYAMIKEALEGSSLYRLSLKGDEIILSFISPQVGERYSPQILDLSRKTGWKLAINPQANQGAILEKARSMLTGAGWLIHKGPGFYPERGEVVASLASHLDPEVLGALSAAFEGATGYRLSISTPALPAAQKTPAPQNTAEFVEIPITRIRLRPYHQGLVLDPEKLGKAVGRARRMGIAPPIQVRRQPDGYLLLDGLYRLMAAQELGLELIPAKIE